MSELPGEVEKQALKRRIRLHEFLMSGGVAEGYKDGIMSYSGPVVAADWPVCPWHGEGCEAWQKIFDGEGEWTRLEKQLADLSEERDALVIVDHVGPEEAGQIADLTMQITDLKRKLADRPRDAKALRDRTPEQFEAERAANKPGVYAAAGKSTGGYAWDKHPAPTPAPRIEDTRDVVDRAAASLGEVADEITIEGEEDE